MAFAVNAVDVALPFASVITVSVAAGVPPSANRPLAPAAGAVKVTETPITPLPSLSVTVATSGFVNAVLTAALCPPPLVAARFAAAPAVFVRLKLAGVAAPEAEAVTV